VEVGRFRRAEGPLAVGDTTFDAPRFDEDGFALGQLWADLQMAALLNHTLAISGRLQAPIGGDALPLQRWTMVGGDRTLYTYPVGAFHGDRLAWVHTRYSIPAPEVMRLPLLGPPTLDLLHVAAMAWNQAEDRDLEQSIGAQLRAGFLYVRVMADPAGVARRELAVGFIMPMRSLPWQRNRD
jgi:hypothetical protein